MTKRSLHQSVLTEEIMSLLMPKSGGIYLDGTFGGGGHSRRLLELSRPNGLVYALDRDPTVTSFVKGLKEDYPKRLIFKAIAFDQVSKLGQQFDGAIFDLGLSTDQLESSGRGFSFKNNEPLDMRFDSQKGQNAAQLLNQSSVTELERIFREFGEDRRPGQLAGKITASRRRKPIRTTHDLVALVGTTDVKVLSRIFQALRIAVNDELNQLKRALDAIGNCLRPEGVLAVISFHSLEDRIVKDFLRTNLVPITKKPITASETELVANPRSRSAKLRAGRKIG